MKNHLVEIYLDSYNSEPLVTQMTEAKSFDQDVCQWLESKIGCQIDVERQLKIEDVSHRTSALEGESTQLRVKIVP